MSKRVYFESVKKWLAGTGIVAGTAITGIFIYLAAIGAIDVTGVAYTEHCAGTEHDPCYLWLNFTANEDIFIYPEGYDPWGRDTPFSFNPAVSGWKIERSWGSGWREFNLNKSCMWTWCGAPYNGVDAKYSIAFREGRDYQIRVTAYKNRPRDVIEWQINPEGVWAEAKAEEKCAKYKTVQETRTVYEEVERCYNKTVYVECKESKLKNGTCPVVEEICYNSTVAKKEQYDKQVCIEKEIVYAESKIELKEKNMGCQINKTHVCCDDGYGHDGNGDGVWQSGETWQCWKLTDKLELESVQNGDKKIKQEQDYLVRQR